MSGVAEVESSGIPRVDVKGDGLCTTPGQVASSRIEVRCVSSRSAGIDVPHQNVAKRGRRETGWPDRLYVIGTDGRVRYKSAAGPFGFSTRDLEAVLEQTPTR